MVKKGRINSSTVSNYGKIVIVEYDFALDCNDTFCI